MGTEREEENKNYAGVQGKKKKCCKKESMVSYAEAQKV